MTEVAANYNINTTANNMDAILKTLKDDKIWKSMEEFDCDEKNKIKLGGGPAPVVGPHVSEWKLVYLNDPRAIEVAKWAVAEYNRRNGSDRVYVTLLRGRKRNLEIGTVYALRIANNGNGRRYQSRAGVFEDAKTRSRELISWEDK